MNPRSRVPGVVAALAGLALIVGVVVAFRDNGGSRSEFSKLGDIEYVLAGDLPDGWVVSHATERPGRPRAEWDSRTDVLVDDAGERFVLLTAIHQGEVVDTADGEPYPTQPDAPRDVDAGELSYLFAIVLGEERFVDPSSLRGREVSWYGGDFFLSVTIVASAPDDQLLLRIAREFTSVRDIEFGTPPAARLAGLQRAASAPNYPEDLTDYSVVWTPADRAGANREEATSGVDAGPTIFINVGCRFYTQAVRDPPTDPQAAPVTTGSDGLLDLSFVLNGSGIRVSGREVSETTLRSFASSLRTYDRDSWRAQLGDRLLVDEPDEE